MLRKTFMTIAILCALAACDRGGGRAGEGISPDISGYPETPFTITQSSQLIGGPVAIGRIGDVLLENDNIRVIIQKPGKNPSVGSFGGSIIDADLQRSSEGHDQFGEIFPMVNVEWTVNYYNYEVISDGEDGSPKILRAYGRVDVYDYLDLDMISEVAESFIGQAASFSNRFDDRRDPFDVYDDLRGLDPEVVTDYILEQGKPYVRIETTFRNRGAETVRMPIGEYISSSGQLSRLVPGAGFIHDLLTQAGTPAPAIIYAGFDGVPVSYGYFYNPQEFLDDEGIPRPATALTFSGITGVLLGEQLLKLLPLGGGGTPEIYFSIPSEETKTVTRYFVVGDGSAGSVMDAGLEALGISARDLHGKVVDALGNPVEHATVAVQNRGGGTVVTYRSGSDGRFSGKLPTGADELSKLFGKGTYSVHVNVDGVHTNGTTESGACEPSSIDVTTSAATVTCTLGESGTVEVASALRDAATNRPIAARLTIVGTDPSPNAPNGAGIFHDEELLMRPFGIVDVKYIAANGTIDLTGKKSFSLEPGLYRFVVSHGPEYSAWEKMVEVDSGAVVTLENISLRRVVETPGFIASDFHIHGIMSPDSAVSQEARVLQASAEGLDVLQSSDHDYLTNYKPIADALMQQGLIPSASLKTSVGDEITPNQFGHIHAFPLEHDAEHVAGGAIDWSAHPLDDISTAPDYALGLSGIIEAARADPGEEVIQLNHIADSTTSVPTATGWVTSPFYEEGFGVSLLSTFADPVERRIEVEGLSATFPKPYGSSDLLSADINAVELTIGVHMRASDSFFRSALPTWFHLLNAGMHLTATANSDSHTDIETPIGLPRNYIASRVDPRDGHGSDFDAIDLEEYALHINEGRVIVSAGPFLSVTATGEDGSPASVGDVVSGSGVDLDIDVVSPSWAWFDTIEVYVNTEPLPVDDETGTPMSGTAATPSDFYRPYHVPQYTYQPLKSFRLIDGSLAEWEEEDGKITAHVSTHLALSEDSWIVVMARGTKETVGYRSLFPLVTRVLVDEKEILEEFDPADLTSLHTHKNVAAPAWALSNPIYVDIDGDGFQSLYMQNGSSPLAH